MKVFLPTILFALLITGCSNFLSSYRTVYRIETTNGERYYSDSEPDYNSRDETYDIEDLDGNEYRLSKDSIYQIEKFKHKK